MGYREIKEKLFNSEEIQRIADQWRMQVPMICRIDNKRFDAFFFFSGQRENVLKAAILVAETENVKMLFPEEIVEIFGLSKISFEQKKIEDYDRYFYFCDEYERLFEEHHEELIQNNKLSKEAGEKLDNALRSIAGDDLYTHFIEKLCREYISLLRLSMS